MLRASPTLGSLGPLTSGVISPGCYTGVPLVPMMFQAFLMERCVPHNAFIYVKLHLHVAQQKLVHRERVGLQFWHVKYICDANSIFFRLSFQL